MLRSAVTLPEPRFEQIPARTGVQKIWRDGEAVMKMRGWRRLAVAILLLALTVPASAQDRNSANYLLPGCKSWLDSEKKLLAPDEAFCVGFVVGLGYGVGGNHFCPPQGVTNNQVVAVVVKYIEARAERMHEDFGKLAVEALMAAWPCKR